MSEYLVLTGLAATMLFAILTFLRINIATSFRDFAVFIASIILAIASTLAVTGGEGVTLAAGIFLYVNAVWFYGVGNAQQSARKAFFAPSAPRVFIGLLFFIIATWIAFSGIDLRITLIILLVSILLAAYKVRMLEKK